MNVVHGGKQEHSEDREVSHRQAWKKCFFLASWAKFPFCRADFAPVWDDVADMLLICFSPLKHKFPG